MSSDTAGGVDGGTHMSGFRKPRFSLFLDTSSVGGFPLS